MRKFVSAALLISVSATPAWAHEDTGLQAPGRATASLNLRVPLGGPRVESAATYGLTLSYGQTVGVSNVDGRVLNRAINLADFRFNEDGLRNARVATFDLANLDQDRRLNLAGGGKKTWLLFGGIIAAGVAICLATDCIDGDDTDSTPS